jgi:K+-transporting ATPase ATPase C chain
MWKALKPAFLMMVVMTVITGLAYPALITALAQAAFPRQANGNLITVNGQIVGSRLIGQRFTKPEYFHPRPSAAGGGYDATASGGTNLGPTSARLLNGTTKTDDQQHEAVEFDGVKDRIIHYAIENGIPFESSQPLDDFRNANGDLDDVELIKAFNDQKAPLVFRPRTPIPADAVTTSASGLDPHISPANAELQAARVARARGVSLDDVKAAIARHTDGRTLGFIGEPVVNVLELNLDLDDRFPKKLPVVAQP